MTNDLRHRIDAWLFAEDAREDARAEEAFGAMIAALPRFAPSADFAARVAAAAVPRVVRRSALESSWGWKAAIAAAVAMAGVTAGLLPLARVLPVRVPGWGEVVAAVASAASWIVDWTRSGVFVWETLARIGKAVAVAAATPEVGAGLVASVALAVGALLTLHQLLQSERRVVG